MAISINLRKQLCSVLLILKEVRKDFRQVDEGTCLNSSRYLPFNRLVKRFVDAESGQDANVLAVLAEVVA